MRPKHTEAEMQSMLQLRRVGWTYHGIAARYGVSQAVARRLVARADWQERVRWYNDRGAGRHEVSR
jgi:DNA-binding transcriptional regulator LsrR (DeoR family)